jgi:N-acetylmuramoyl-L-alanine amidase
LLTPQELKCLIDNVYYESRGEPFEGKVLVARTVLNRRLHPSFPYNVCDVIYQPYQFSWTMVKQKLPKQEHWDAAAEAVFSAFYNTSPVMYFHAVSVRPGWAKEKQFITRIGNHLFYK